jgi:hypothetical protein
MPETLFLTCNLIDRFLQAKQVNRKQLQLVRRSAAAAGRPTCRHAGSFDFRARQAGQRRARAARSPAAK